MTRNERKKAAKLKAQANLARLASLAAISRKQETVAANLSAPRERNYYANVTDSLAMVAQSCPSPREARRKLYIKLGDRYSYDRA